MSEQTLVERLHQCARDTKQYGTKYSVRESLPIEAADRIEELERVCEQASSELSAWDGKASADPATSVGYVVKILKQGGKT